MTAALAHDGYLVRFDEKGCASIVGHGIQRESQVRAIVNDLGISLAFGTLLPEGLADLLDIAVAVYVADRLCLRKVREGSRSELDDIWQRRLRIALPLRNAAAWSPERHAKLQSLLAFLTDDDWSFEFTDDRYELRLSEDQYSFLGDDIEGDLGAGLFSGGLDSLAGIVTELIDHPNRKIIAFSARTNDRIGVFQRNQVVKLREMFGQRIKHIPAGIKIEDRVPHAFDKEDRSQRTRGFVFQIFGAVTAAVAGLRTLSVYENGVGAINLPYTSAQLGSQATRATHPITIGLVSDLMTDVLGETFRVSLPHQTQTKSEMCARFDTPELQQLITLTISCDKFPQRIAGKPQCGICPSCLLTRQSLFSAGLRHVDSSDRFRHDIYTLTGDSSVARLYDYRVMSCQAGIIAQSCSESNPWTDLVGKYPTLYRIAREHYLRTGVNIENDVVDMYRRYTTEWFQFREEVLRTTSLAA